MKTLSESEVKKILEEHELWLKTNGKKGKQADFSDTNLSGMDFRGVNLRFAHLDRTDLVDINFQDADLRCAVFCKANLKNTDFRNAKLDDTYFSCACLTDANFRNADLNGANFYMANLLNADFRNARLCDAFLNGSNLLTHSHG